MPLFIPQHQKTHLEKYASSKEPDQHAHSCSLIRIFTGRILDSRNAKFLHADNED